MALLQRSNFFRHYVDARETIRSIWRHCCFFLSQEYARGVQFLTTELNNSPQVYSRVLLENYLIRELWDYIVSIVIILVTKCIYIRKHFVSID